MMMTIFDYKQTAIEDHHDSFIYILDAVAKDNAFYILFYSLDEEIFDVREVPFTFDTDKKWKVERNLSSGDYRRIFNALFYDHETYYIDQFYNKKLS